MERLSEVFGIYLETTKNQMHGIKRVKKDLVYFLNDHEHNRKIFI
ncbi:hypothetical protein [Clostridium sp. DJ247]|nr:hypothetical protein [Clostridium sp. DJ247]